MTDYTDKKRSQRPSKWVLWSGLWVSLLLGVAGQCLVSAPPTASHLWTLDCEQDPDQDHCPSVAELLNDECLRSPFLDQPACHEADFPFPAKPVQPLSPLPESLPPVEPPVIAISTTVDMPSGHSETTINRVSGILDGSTQFLGCQPCDEELSYFGDVVVPPAVFMDHCAPVMCGSESELPLETRSCSHCEATHIVHPELAPLATAVQESLVGTEPDQKPVAAETPRRVRGRSSDAMRRPVAAVESTEAQPSFQKAPQAASVPVDQQPPVKPVESKLAKPSAGANPNYPRLEVDPESMSLDRLLGPDAPTVTQPTETLAPAPQPEPQAPPANSAPTNPAAQRRGDRRDPNAPAPAPNSQGYLINFQNVSMAEYVRFVAQLTGKNFIYNSDDLQFTVTIVSKEPTTLDNIMAALLQELRIHGLALMEQGNNLIIYPQSGVVSPATLFSEDSHSPQEIVTRVFRIEHVSSEKISDIVTRMLSPQALVQTLPDSNTLIVTDLSTNVDRISDIIRVLDLPSQTFDIGQYAVNNGLAGDVIPIAQQLLAPFSSGRPPVLVEDPKTNSVYIVASPEMVKQSISILQKLDGRRGATEVLTVDALKRKGDLLTRPGAIGAGGEMNGLTPFNQPQQPFIHPSELHTKFYIHKLQYRQGDQLQDALYRIADSLRLDEKANIDLINTINSVQWLESSNALVITGTAESVGRVKELIEELDISLRQILLEMLIIDTTVADSLQYSVDLGDQFSSQYVGSALNNVTLAGEQPVGSSIWPFSVAQTNAGTINPSLVAPPLGSLPKLGFNLGIIGRRIFKGANAYTTIGALVRAIHTDEVAEIVLNPKILVEDNFPAEVFVGENTPFATQSVVNQNSNFVTQNVEYRDVGTTLKVTPQLGNGDMITLTIEQEVSTIDESATRALNVTGSSLIAPTTRKSNTITKVHVPDGYFVILSGVMNNSYDRTRSQIPCLGGVPILGAFAGSKNNTVAKRNILIFIRPQIIDEDWQYDEITRHNQNMYNEKNRRKPRWKYETDEALDFLNLPRFDDGCPPPDWEYGGGGW